MAWYQKQAIAHRGLHDITRGIPENSFLAFEKAIKHHFAIELDIRITQDNQIVVIHDSQLKRLTGAKKIVEESLYEEIKDLLIANTHEKIPLLHDVLQLIDAKVPILIEIKNDKTDGKFEKILLTLLLTYWGKFAIHSFNVSTLLWFKKNAPKIKRGQIIGHIPTKGIASFLYQIPYFYHHFFTKPDFIAIDVNLLPSVLIKCYRNTPKLSWTINTKNKEKLAKKFVDNIIFEKIKIET